MPQPYGSLGEDDTLRIASANLEEGGIEEDSSTARWALSIAALAAWEPHVVCVQEMAARRDPLRLRKHLQATANALGMIPVLGSEGGVSGNHTAILVSPELTVIDTGPPPRQPGHDPAWTEALLRLPSGVTLSVYSIHLPPGSATEQRIHAERLASQVSQRGERTIAAGDWNCWAPSATFTPGALAAMPPHLRPARMRQHGGQWAANHDVHDILAGTGLADAAAGLEPARRDPPGLPPVVDRFYVTAGIWDAGAVQGYARTDGGGSDHPFALLTLGAAGLDRAAAPGFQP